jgi:hypothetical protein
VRKVAQQLDFSQRALGVHGIVEGVGYALYCHSAARQRVARRTVDVDMAGCAM